MASLIQTLGQKFQHSISYIKGTTPQILFGLSVVSCLYLMSKQKEDETEIQVSKPQKITKKKASSQKDIDSKEKSDIIQDLKKSQRKLNKKFNRQFDDSIEITEDIIPRSPDYSVISEIDQKFFQEMFLNKQQSKKAYQTDFEDSHSIKFKGYKKSQILIDKNDAKTGEDRLFFQLQSRVIEQSEEEVDNEEQSY